MCLYVVSGGGGVYLFVLQETGGVGGGQQPDRGDLPDLAATANHLVLASPALAYQRLRQPGTGLQRCRKAKLFFFFSLFFFFLAFS